MHGVFGDVSTIGTSLTVPGSATRRQQITSGIPTSSPMDLAAFFVRYDVIYYPNGINDLPGILIAPVTDAALARSWAEVLVCRERPQSGRVILALGRRADGKNVTLGHWGANGTVWVGADYPWSDTSVVCPRQRPLPPLRPSARSRQQQRMSFGQAGGCPPGQIGIPPFCIPTGASAGPATPMPAPGMPTVPGLPSQMPVSQKTVNGFTYRLADPSLVLQLRARLNVHGPVPVGHYKNIALPKTVMELVSSSSGTGSAFSQWTVEEQAKGNGIVITGPTPPTAGLVIPTRSVKLASDLAAADPLSVVLVEPQEGWLMPDAVTATGEPKPPYLLYAAIGGAALLVVVLVASRD